MKALPKLKLGKTFKPFNPNSASADKSLKDLNQEQQEYEDENLDMSFLNKVFANDEISKSDIWLSPESPREDDDSDKVSTTCKLSSIDHKDYPSCSVNFKGDYSNGKLSGTATLVFENGN